MKYPTLEEFEQMWICTDRGCDKCKMVHPIIRDLCFTGHSCHPDRYCINFDPKKCKITYPLFLKKYLISLIEKGDK